MLLAPKPSGQSFWGAGCAAGLPSTSAWRQVSTAAQTEASRTSFQAPNTPLFVAEALL